MEKTVDIKKLFNEKRYSEIILIVDHKIPEKQKNSALMNLVGVCRLLKSSKVNKTDLVEAIEDFRKAYRKEKKTSNSLEAFRNFINTSVNLYDFENTDDNHQKTLKNFEEALSHFKKDQNYFSDDPQMLLSIIRIYTRLVDLKKVRFYLNYLVEKEYFTPLSLRLLIYNNCFVQDWSQDKFLKFANKLNDILPVFDQDKLIPIKKKVHKKVRLAFFSSDLRKKHSVSFFLKTVLSSYDKNKFEIYLYLNHRDFKDDETTSLFKGLVDKSFNTAELNNIDLINLIRGHQLNILIDLMGITSGSRLEIIKNRVAPIQISWCGYCNTTGIKEMDYMISDSNLIQQKELELYQEKIIFMPNIWNTHSGFDFKRSFNEAPVLKNKTFTFGSFNNFSKINDDVIKTWSEIIHTVKNSKLILKSSSQRVNDLLIDKFTKENIINSIQLISHFKSFDEHINFYKKIDLALDTFPYNGVTTSFEAIWMGVPVLTMEGYNFNSRCGESINKNLGLINLIAKDEKDYILKAKKLANDEEGLKNIRKKIYNEAINSPLFDSKKFNNDFYKLLQSLKVSENG